MKALIIVVLLILTLTGCPGNPTKDNAQPIAVKVPEVQIVTQTIKEYVSIPSELLAHCYNEPAKQQAALEAKRLANLRDLSIKECNKRLDKAQELNGKAK